MTAFDGDGRTPGMRATYEGPTGGASVRDVRRLLAAHGGLAAATDSGESLERLAQPASPPRLEAAAPLEGAHIEARTIGGEPVVAFGAFLDGIQRSVVASYLHATVPVVHGTIAAAVRARRDRTLRTWGSGPLVERALFLPVALAGGNVTRALAAAGFPVFDTLPADAQGTAGGGDVGGVGLMAGAAGAGRHPDDLLGLARLCVQQRREQAEERCAAEWCRSERAPLYVDGGIGGFAEVSRSPWAVGVVKSHHTLYVAPEAVVTVAALTAGQRTSAFVVAPRRRTGVASWYLRLRDTGNPLGGLVRVEVAAPGFDSARADLVSRWVLAEREPVALPDPRWPVMAYGIRDCEEYLRAVAG